MATAPFVKHTPLTPRLAREAINPGLECKPKNLHRRASSLLKRTLLSASIALSMHPFVLADTGADHYLDKENYLGKKYYLDKSQAQLLEENLPFSDYMEYPEGVEPVSQPIAIEFGQSGLEVIEQSGRIGHVNPGNFLYQEGGFIGYPLLDYSSAGLGQWSVRADGDIYLNLGQSCSNIAFPTGMGQLTEIHFEPEAQNFWVFDANTYELLKLDSEAELIQRYSPGFHSFPSNKDDSNEGDLNNAIFIEGISSYHGKLWLLSSENNQQFVYELSEMNGDLKTERAWQLDINGAGHANDLIAFDKYSVLLSRSNGSPQLLQASDKNAFTGPGPVAANEALNILNATPLPDIIKQPSGIIKSSDQWWVLTDQAEVYILNDDRSEILETINLQFSEACQQGCTEVIVSSRDNEFYVVADDQRVVHYRRDTNNFNLVKEFTLNSVVEGLDKRLNEELDGVAFSAATYVPELDSIFMVSNSVNERDADTLFRFDSQLRLESTTPLSYQGQLFDAENEYNAEGLAYYNHQLLLMSEAFTEILVLSTEGELNSVIDFTTEPLREPSDMTLADGKLWMIGDHENDEPNTPLTEYVLPSTVSNPICDVKSWRRKTVYTDGDQVLWKNKVYEANWWTRGDKPGRNKPWSPWQAIGSCQ